MPRPLLTGAALGVIAFLAPQVALAQCEQRLERAVAAIGTLSDSVDRRVHDQLIDLHDEAGGNDGPCVEAGVARMEEVLRRNGAQIEGDGGRAATGQSRGGASAGSAGAAASRPSLVQVTPPTPFSRTAQDRMAGLPAAQQAEARDVARYVENIRGFGVQISGELAAQAPAQANEVALTTNTAIAAAEALQQTLMQPSHIEMLYDQLADSIRDVQQADAALSAAYQAVLRDRSSSTSLDRLEAALAHSQSMQAKLDQLEGRATEGKYEALAEGRPEGYEAAFRALEAKHQSENRSLDVRCEGFQRAAEQKFVEDLQSGRVVGQQNELGFGLAQCQAISFPVWEQQQREWDELEARFATPDDLAPPRPRRNPPRSAPPRPQAAPPRPPTDQTPPPPPPAAEQEPKPMGPEEIAQQRRERDQARSDARRALDQALRTAEENPNSHEAQVKVDGAKMVLQHAEEAYRGHLSQHSPSEVADYDAEQYRAARRPMRPIDNIQEQVRSNPAPDHRPTGDADQGYLPTEARPIDGVARNPAPQGGLTPPPAPEAGLASALRGFGSGNAGTTPSAPAGPTS